MGNRQSNGNQCTVLSKRGADKQADIKDFMSTHRGKDLYELFEVERYSGDEFPDEFKAQVNKKFKQLALKYHPDKENRDEYRAVFQYIATAKDILLDPDAKRRYDNELRRTRQEETRWDALRWWGRWAFNASLIIGGIGLIFGGLASATPTAGAGLAMSIVGSSMLSAGIRGAAIHYNDPDASNYEYLKEVGVGALAGAAGGAIGGVCAGAIQGLSAAAQVGIAAAGGASTALVNHAVEDAVNVADGTTSAKELLTLEHISSVGKSVVVGACAGMAVQGIASALQGSSAQAKQIVDDAATSAVSATKKIGKAGAGVLALKAGKEGVKKSLNAATTVGKFFEGAGKKMLANTAGAAVQTSGDVLHTSAVLYAKGEASLKDGAWFVAQDAAVSLAVGTTVAAATALAAQGVEHGKAVSLLRDMEQPANPNDIGHAQERHMVPVEAAEARALVDDSTPASFFQNADQYNDAMNMPTSSSAGVVLADQTGENVGGSVKFEKGKFEYRSCTQTKVVQKGGGVLTAYPVHRTGKIVDRNVLSTPFLRSLPSTPLTEVVWVHHSSGAGRRKCVYSNEWSMWACEQDSIKPHCFVPRTRFRTPGEVWITAASLKLNGGDVLLGPDGPVTVSKAITHEASDRDLVSVWTEGMTRPFEVTAEHRVLVEGAEGQITTIEARMLAEWQLRQNSSSTELPKVRNGIHFVSIIEAKLITRNTEIVGIKFASDDDVVLAWLVAEPRTSRRRQRSLPPEAAVACLGSKQTALDHIRDLWTAESN